MAARRTCSISIYEQAAPLYVYQICGKIETPEQLHRELLDRLEQRYQRHETLAEVYDLRYASVPNVLVREQLTAWVTLNARLIHERVAASVVIMRRPLLRWFLQAVWRIVPPPAQHYAVTATPAQAIDIALQSLALAEAAPGPAAVRLLQEALEPEQLAGDNGG